MIPYSIIDRDEPNCVVSPCWMHHWAYDTGALELLPFLEPRYAGLATDEWRSAAAARPDARVLVANGDGRL